jgi:hypothetical protein
MQEEGVPLFIMLLVSAAIIGIFIIVAALLGVILLP